MFSGRWMVASTYRSGSAPHAVAICRAAASSGSMARVASTMVFPVSSMLSAGTPSPARLAAARRVGAQCTSASTPTTQRLTSFGIARSCERSPASTSTTGTPT